MIECYYTRSEFIFSKISKINPRLGMCVSCDQCIHETPVTDHCEDISQWLVLAVITHDTSSYD